MKPGLKTTELYVIMFAIGCLLWLLHALSADLPAIVSISGHPAIAGLVPVVQLLLGLAIPAIAAYYAKLRRDLKLDAGAPDAPATGKPMGMVDTRLSGSLALVLLAGILCSSCAHVTPYEAKLIQCGEKSIQDQLPGLLPQVGNALAGGSVDWSAALDQLLAAAGEATVCAVEVSIAQLEAQEASNAPRQASAFQAVPSMVQLSRAHSWLQGAQWTRHYRASVALWAK